jgi:Nif-specific regulatory protein
MDISLLLDHFLETWSEGSTPSPDAWALEALLLYSWPGNVRELELCVRSLLALHGRETVLRANTLPPQIAHKRARVATASRESRRPGSELRGGDDLARLVESLQANGGCVADAAKAIGISRPRAYRLMRGQPMAELLANVRPNHADPGAEPPPSSARNRER